MTILAKTRAALLSPLLCICPLTFGACSATSEQRGSDTSTVEGLTGSTGGAAAGTGTVNAGTTGSTALGANSGGAGGIGSDTTQSATTGSGTAGAGTTTSTTAATDTLGSGGAGTDGSGTDMGITETSSSAGGANGTATTTSGGGDDTPCAASATLEAGDSAHSLTVGGNTYPFNVHAPPAYDGVTRLPVVFDFHGLGGDENQMVRLSGWASTGDAQGFITVFPGGVGNAWNAGACCSDTTTDVDFVREAIAYLDSVACIDMKRIYASGCSNGGAMSYRLACEAADVIAAVAPVDFDCVVGGGCGSCSPARPITEIQFRGTNDSAVPYSGAEPNFERWGEINQCSGSPEPLPENSSCERHPMCADGVESILCTVQDGPHCGSYSSFGIAQLAWEIISRYSLP